MKLLQMHALAQGFGRGRVPFPTVYSTPPTTNLPDVRPPVSSSSAERPPEFKRSDHVMSKRSPRPFKPMPGVATVTEYSAPRILMRGRGGFRGVGDSDALVPGDYHISGTQVQLRSGPKATSAVKGVLVNGEGVYVFGDLETDPDFMLGPNNEAVPNDGSDPGIIYARVGTQNNGAGWVAAYFLASGPGSQVQPQPTPAPTPTPGPITPPMTTEKKSYLVPVLVGGAIGATVLLGGALLYRASKKSRTRAYA